MSDKRYQAGVLQGIAKSRTHGGWPQEIKGLGRARGGQPMVKCSRCPPETHPAISTTFVRYGGIAFCKGCAILEAKAAGAAA